MVISFNATFLKSDEVKDLIDPQYPYALSKNLGEPDESFKNEIGNFIFIYNTKKYGISCKRSFEVNSNSIVIGFVSKGCF